ncbi:unknown [[Mannheimia] succiniciproducens MBEL55E]|uniref:Uncharacterized protein n=1 Tax=Mannheimia succiniciproducens (strain KCTC 0769BP / MBEL55E) TaxID=221988 RepID=Q65QC9_MANSM|nr:unknown [[Mannheimia] succiniciproducens MBEL55E]
MLFEMAWQTTKINFFDRTLIKKSMTKASLTGKSGYN